MLNFSLSFKKFDRWKGGFHMTKEELIEECQELRDALHSIVEIIAEVLDSESTEVEDSGNGEEE